MAPEWLLLRTQDTMLRQALQSIRNYREACRGAGRFLSENEYPGSDAPPAPPSPADDFDKLWADAVDGDTGAVVNLSHHDHTELFRWLAVNAAAEQPHIAATAIEHRILEGAEPTRVFDLRFRNGAAETVERWQIAFADAPNSQNRLRNQVEAFLNGSYDAKPALLRVGNFTRVTQQGEPVKSIAHVRESQAGPPLADLLAAGGRLAPTTKKDWLRLRLARSFVEGHREAVGFAAWRAERRFLLDGAEIGVMTRLVQPEGTGGSGDGEGADMEDEQPPATAAGAGGSQAAISPSEDPRDRADIPIGQALEGGADIGWTLDKRAEPALPNFGMLVSGDAGQGKTQIIKAVIAEAAAFKIGVAGTHSTGKTTFLQQLRGRLLDHGLRVRTVADLAPAALAAGFPMLRDHTFESTAWIIARGIHLELEEGLRHDVVLVDRPTPDALGYLVAALRHGGRELETGTMRFLKDWVRGHAATYALLVKTVVDRPPRVDVLELRVAVRQHAGEGLSDGALTLPCRRTASVRARTVRA